MSDNISRQAVIDALYKCRFWSCSASKVVIEFDDAYDAVCNVPPLDRTGNWVVDIYDSRAVATCDSCSTRFARVPIVGGKVQWDFCPKCGADMR